SKKALEQVRRLHAMNVGTKGTTREIVPRAHTAWPINKKAYAGSLPLCNQCKSHHGGPCTVKCGNCKKVGHIIQNFRTPTTAKNQRTHTCCECGSLRHYKRVLQMPILLTSKKGTGASQKATCYECRNQGHYRRDCPERKNQNHENQIKSTKSRGVVHAFGGGEIEQDLNNIEDEIEA
nr:reverse transcriptase domain-containing protein [Tanacetum cinerariifolium]